MWLSRHGRDFNLYVHMIMKHQERGRPLQRVHEYNSSRLSDEKRKSSGAVAKLQWTEASPTLFMTVFIP